MLTINDQLPSSITSRTKSTSYAFKLTPRIKKLLIKEAEKILKYLVTTYQRPCHHITLVFMLPPTIDAIAEKFTPTQLKKHKNDILTFAYTENPHEAIEGDILLCPERIFTYAAEDLKAPAHAIIETILHGMLHLYGLKHTYSLTALKKVYRHQNTILTNLNINWSALSDLVQPL